MKPNSQSEITDPVPSPSAAAPKNGLRDNLEWIAVLILLVLAFRQLVLEPFKIPTGSMAPTLLGVHKEVRCPNCGWTFRVGHNKLGPGGQVTCHNCLYTWQGAASVGISFRPPAWLWHEGKEVRSGHRVTGADAANRVNRWGSRIFVNKFIYRLRKPRRWEVAVFAYPYYKVTCRECLWSGEVRSLEDLQCPDCASDEFEAHRKNYIKRLVGLPGEEILIQNGDIYVNGEIARKPPAIQGRLWQHVLDSRFVPEKRIEPLWDFGSDGDLWTHDTRNGSLAVNAVGSGDASLAAFARPIRDSAVYNGSRSSHGMGFGGVSARDVGDCRIEVALTAQDPPAASGCSVVLQILEDEHAFSFWIPIGRSAEAVLKDAGTVVASAQVEGLRPGEKVRAALENYDDRVVASLRGRPLITCDYQGSPRPARRRNRVALGAAGAKVTFHSVRIQRDLYYLAGKGTPAGPATYDVDQNSYFVLGDNTAESSDSRAWPAPGVPEENLLGEAFAVFWPVHDIRILSLGSE